MFKFEDVCFPYFIFFVHSFSSLLSLYHSFLVCLLASLSINILFLCIFKYFSTCPLALSFSFFFYVLRNSLEMHLHLFPSWLHLCLFALVLVLVMFMLSCCLPTQFLWLLLLLCCCSSSLFFSRLFTHFIY